MNSAGTRVDSALRILTSLCCPESPVGSGTAFSPATIAVETVGAAVTVTGRALAASDMITLQFGTTCPSTGGAVVLTSAATVGGSAGSRTLVASASSVTTLIALG